MRIPIVVKSLTQLAVPSRSRVHDVVCPTPSEEGDVLIRRLLELGFLPGEPVELRHRHPFGGGAIVAAVRGTLVGLRRDEAACILVEEEL